MAEQPTVTHYDDVITHFVRSSGAEKWLRAWRADPHKAQVVPFVEASRTRALYKQTPDSVLAVCRQTEHALGDVKKVVAQSVGSIVNWHPSFAFEHVLSHADETLGMLPTYQRFRGFVTRDPLARVMLLEPSKAAVAEAVESGASEAAAKASMRWRVGNAYLAHLKQAYVIATLRAAGINARYHVLADVLFRVDFWVQDTCFALYVANKRFREGALGRKVQASEILGGGFRYVELRLNTRHEYGTVHLPDASDAVRQAQAALAR